MQQAKNVNTFNIRQLAELIYDTRLFLLMNAFLLLVLHLINESEMGIGQLSCIPKVTNA